MEQVSDTTMMIGIDGQGLWEVQSDTYEIINIYKYDIDRKTSLSGNGFTIFIWIKKRAASGSVLLGAGLLTLAGNSCLCS